MRYVIYGAGAIGGTIGAALHLQGHEVILIARGPHARALQAQGLTFVVPGQTHTLRIPTFELPQQIDITADDVVLLAMKSQHTAPALQALRAATNAEPMVLCAQNGVENERLALRWFGRVYAVLVVTPASHLQPGCIEAHSRNVYGLLDVGRYCGGNAAVSDPASGIVAQISGAGFTSELRADIMAWKYRKLISNLGNALDMLIGDAVERRDLQRMLRGEATAALAAAGINVVSDADFRQRIAVLDRSVTDTSRRAGSSTWQSLARGTGNVETDYLNGEIVFLGRQHGVPTPVNALLQELCADHAANKRAPGEHSPAALLGQARALQQAVYDGDMAGRSTAPKHQPQNGT